MTNEGTQDEFVATEELVEDDVQLENEDVQFSEELEGEIHCDEEFADASASFDDIEIDDNGMQFDDHNSDFDDTAEQSSKELEEGEHSSKELEEGEHSSKELGEGEHSSKELEKGEHSSKELEEGEHSSKELEEGEHSSKELEEGEHSSKELEEGELPRRAGLEEEADSGSDYGHDDPLYAGAAITVGVAMTLILAFIVRHKLTNEAISDLLFLIDHICPKPNRCCKTLYKFKKVFLIFDYSI